MIVCYYSGIRKVLLLNQESEKRIVKESKLNKDMGSLLEAVLSLKNTVEAEKFFRDLCTISELKEMSERWKVACLLDQGLTYRAIADEAKVSTTTVSRVAMWLNYGKDGYKLVLKRVSHHNSPLVSKKS